MIALAITLAFVACVASFTSLRLRAMQLGASAKAEEGEELALLRSTVEDISRDIDAIEEMATEAKATAQSAANAVAVRKR